MPQTETQNGAKADESSNGRHLPKRGKRTKALPSLNAATGVSEMSEAAFKGNVDSSQTDWSLVPLYSSISVSEDGSNPMMKVSKSRAIDLISRKAVDVGGGRCYLVTISNK
jgi:hypothetical protein